MKFNKILYTIAVVLPLLWLLGVITSHTIGGMIHLLPVLAIVAALIRVFRDEDTWA
jgi:hypothetical protein